MDFVPVLVIDNFFDNPDSIREQGLSLDFNVTGNYPGLRTNCPDHIRSIVYKKVISLLVDSSTNTPKAKVEVAFQLVTKEQEENWIHMDRGGFFAGVIYLTPDAPINSGTSIYKFIGDADTFEKVRELDQVKNNFHKKILTDHNEMKSAREKMKQYFCKTVDVANVYNRLILYPANLFHSGNNFFGTTKNDARLTLVIYVHNVEPSNSLPIRRMKLIEE